MHAPIPTQMDRAPRGRSWSPSGQLLNDESGSPMRPKAFLDWWTSESIRHHMRGMDQHETASWAWDAALDHQREQAGDQDEAIQAVAELDAWVLNGCPGGPGKALEPLGVLREFLQRGIAPAAAPALRRHKFWGAGERDCPPELKAPNGELHTMRCKVCGDAWRKSTDVCFGKAVGAPA